MLIVEPCITSGNQECIGTSPSFMEIANVNRAAACWFCRCIMVHCPVVHALSMLANRIIAAAAA